MRCTDVKDIFNLKCLNKKSHTASGLESVLFMQMVYSFLLKYLDVRCSNSVLLESIDAEKCHIARQYSVSADVGNAESHKELAWSCASRQ